MSHTSSLLPLRQAAAARRLLRYLPLVLFVLFVIARAAMHRHPVIVYAARQPESVSRDVAAQDSVGDREGESDYRALMEADPGESLKEKNKYVSVGGVREAIRLERGGGGAFAG